VKFRLKNDPQGPVQYGLIAEEVDRVYPELVIRNAEGRIEGVHYEELAPMLLNEVQRQQRRLDAQEESAAARGQLMNDLLAEIAAQKARIDEQAQQLRDLQLLLVQITELKERLAVFEAQDRAVHLSPVRWQVTRGL